MLYLQVKQYLQLQSQTRETVLLSMDQIHLEFMSMAHQRRQWVVRQGSTQLAAPFLQSMWQPGTCSASHMKNFQSLILGELLPKQRSMAWLYNCCQRSF